MADNTTTTFLFSHRAAQIALDADEARIIRQPGSAYVALLLDGDLSRGGVEVTGRPEEIVATLTALAAKVAQSAGLPEVAQAPF